MWVDITVTVNSVDGRSVGFEVSASDSLEQVGHGSHSRFVVDVAKSIARLKGKIDAVNAA
jgi:fluoroacetyl-CoA thioesterase